LYVRVLGTAAGGGYPQWNCACRLCRRVRSEATGLRPRLHASLALSVTSKRWYLVNATPDVRFQIESYPALHPGPSPRETPVAGVFLTDAELDHTLGLLILREGASLQVYGSHAVLEALADAFPVRRILTSYAPFSWLEVKADESLLLDGGCLRVKAFRAGAKKPRYVTSPETVESEDDWVLGYRFEDPASRGALVYAPGVEQWTAALAAELEGADVVFLDGTFWAEDEIAEMGVGNLTARQMGHLPIGGPEGSAQHLRSLPVRRKVYVHINNTNPVLDEGSEERRRLETWGIEIGFDGMELEV
jgi:pyrroloquinoline quinone biosynthesis protein B